MISTEKDIINLVKSTNSTTEQKINGLVGLARNIADPRETMNYSEQDFEFIKKEMICDLSEGNVVITPRYTLPDFFVYINKGCEYLDLKKPTDLDELLDGLLILYFHTPSVVNYPVYVGNLDSMIDPFLSGNDEEDYKKIKRFLHHIDRTTPTAFCHANIGPKDNKAARLILRATLELMSPTPNITLIYDEELTSDEFAHECLKVSLKTAKPSFANNKIYSKDVDGYGIASCYNALPVKGGGYTLPRIRMGTVAMNCDSLEHCMNDVLPKVVDSMLHIMDVRIKFLVEESNFFEGDFMVQEGFLDKDRFVGMFGFLGLADAVNIFLKQEGINETFGQSERGNEIGKLILDYIESRVENHEAKYSPLSNGKYLLHAQVGTSNLESDKYNTPAHRIKVGQEPELPDHILCAKEFQKYFKAGCGDLFNFDQTYENRPEPILDMIKGAFNMDVRYISPYLVNQDLVRVTGYLAKRSEVAKIKAGQSAFRDGALYGEGMESSQQLLTGRKVVK